VLNANLDESTVVVPTMPTKNSMMSLMTTTAVSALATIAALSRFSPVGMRMAALMRTCRNHGATVPPDEKNVAA
jgi:hypothetical protein